MTDLRISLPHTSYPPAEPAPDHALNEPSRTQSFLQGAILSDYNEHPTTSSFLGQVATGFIPGVGQLADLRDTVKAGQDVLQDKPGSWSMLGLTALAWVPGVGDAVKAYAKAPASIYQAVGTTLNSVSTWAKQTTFSGLENLLSRAPVDGRWFYKPGVSFADDLGNAAGGADRFGNVVISRGMSEAETLRTYHHEAVHSLLSPKFKFGRELRADLKMAIYSNSDLLRYSEEALAEGTALFKVDGLSRETVSRAIRYPIDAKIYGLRPKRIAAETGALVSTFAGAYFGGKFLRTVYDKLFTGAQNTTLPLDKINEDESLPQKSPVSVSK